MRQGDVVLVHCRAGLERAPTVACAALLCSGWSLAEAYRRVIERRRAAAPTADQLAALSALADRIRPASTSGPQPATVPDLTRGLPPRAARWPP